MPDWTSDPGVPLRSTGPIPPQALTDRERERAAAKERADHLTEILRRTVKYGQAWLEASPTNERFRRRQCQAMIETARSALERDDA